MRGSVSILLVQSSLAILVLHGAARQVDGQIRAPLVQSSNPSGSCANGSLAVNTMAKKFFYCAGQQWQSVVNSIQFDANPKLSGTIVVASGQGLQTSQSGHTVVMACNTASSTLIGCAAKDGNGMAPSAFNAGAVRQEAGVVTDAPPRTTSAGTDSAPAIGAAAALPFAQFYQSETHSSSGLMYKAPANRLALAAFYLPYALTASNLTFRVAAVDSGEGFYDLCVYDSAGILKINTGGNSFGTRGIHEVAISQGTVTLTPGWYHFGITGNAALAAIGGDRSGAYYTQYSAGTVSATEALGGTCPSSIILPAVSYQTSPSMPWFVLR